METSRRDDELAVDEEALSAGSVPATSTPSEGLDLETVIKASQAISGEILIDNLVETLMVAALQHADAKRGLLILRRGEDARIEAEAMTESEGIVVRSRGATPGPSDLPDSLLRFVLRTQ